MADASAEVAMIFTAEEEKGQAQEDMPVCLTLLFGLIRLICLRLMTEFFLFNHCDS